MKKYAVTVVALCSLFILNAQKTIAAGEKSTPSEINKLMNSTRPMPILAWSGLPAGLSTVERFMELRDAGFTHHLQVYGEIEDIQKVLDAAGQADVKIFTNIAGPQDKFIARFKKHPALAGYLVGTFDEPLVDAFDALSKEVKAVQALDTDHWCYVNLLPTYGMPYIKKARNYQDYVDKFLKKVPVKVLSFDHYPLFQNYAVVSTRPDFYENLEIIKAVSEKAELPFWAFVLSTAHYNYPVPTLAHLRLQMYSSLAYGAQGMQYFTYFTVTLPDVSPGPIDQSGKKTAVYNTSKKMNKEVHAIDGVFLGSKVISVSHTGKTIPNGTKLYHTKAPFSSLTTTEPGAVVSEIENGNHRFLVVVNRDITKPMTLNVSYDATVKMSVINKDGSISPADVKNKKYKIEPADIKIFMWSTSETKNDK